MIKNHYCIHCTLNFYIKPWQFLLSVTRTSNSNKRVTHDLTNANLTKKNTGNVCHTIPLELALHTNIQRCIYIYHIKYKVGLLLGNLQHLTSNWNWIIYHVMFLYSTDQTLTFFIKYYQNKQHKITIKIYKHNALIVVNLMSNTYTHIK